jgi:hypothetical protein
MHQELGTTYRTRISREEREGGVMGHAPLVCDGCVSCAGSLGVGTLGEGGQAGQERVGSGERERERGQEDGVCDGEVVYRYRDGEEGQGGFTDSRIEWHIEWHGANGVLKCRASARKTEATGFGPSERAALTQIQSCFRLSRKHQFFAVVQDKLKAHRMRRQ